MRHGPLSPRWRLGLLPFAVLFSAPLLANHAPRPGAATAIGGNEWTLQITADAVATQSPVFGSGVFKDAQILFALGLAYGNGPASVAFHNPSGVSRDFVDTGLPIEVSPGVSDPAAVTESVSLAVESVNDALEPELKQPLNFGFVRQTFAYRGAGGGSFDGDFVIFKFTLKNPGADTQHDVFTALVADPDLAALTKAGGSAVNDFAELDVQHQIARATSAPTTPPGQPGAKTPAAPQRPQPPPGSPDTRLEGGLIVLGEPVGSYRPFVSGPGPLSDPASLAEWYGVLSGGIQHPERVGEGDIRQVLGTGARSIGPGGSRVVFFALLGGTQGNLAQVAAAARARFERLPASAHAPYPMTGVELGIEDPFDPAAAGTFDVIVTFPSAELAGRFDEAAVFCTGAPAVSTSEVVGKVVTASFARADFDRRLRDGDEIICAGKLDDGMYWFGRARPRIVRQVAAVTRLTSDPEGESVFDYAATWSPDGQSIAFGSDREACTPLGCGSGIWRLDAGAAAPVRLTTSPLGLDTGSQDSTPDWSPDGSTIVFERDGGIFTVPAAGGALTQLTATFAESGFTHFDRDPHYSPDGEEIVFRRNSFTLAPTGIHLWTMGAAGELGGAPATAITSGDFEVAPFWASDGLVYFFSTRPPDFTGFIYSVDPGLGEASVVQRIPTEPVRSLQPTVSPDGTTLAFTSFTGDMVLQSVAGDPEAAKHEIVYLDFGAEPTVPLDLFDNIELRQTDADTLQLLFQGDGKIYSAALP
jgi:hypothetical protein